jgi:hypothetical protein
MNSLRLGISIAVGRACAAGYGGTLEAPAWLNHCCQEAELLRVAEAALCWGMLAWEGSGTAAALGLFMAHRGITFLTHSPGSGCSPLGAWQTGTQDSSMSLLQDVGLTFLSLPFLIAPAAPLWVSLPGL